MYSRLSHTHTNMHTFVVWSNEWVSKWLIWFCMKIPHKLTNLESFHLFGLQRQLAIKPNKWCEIAFAIFAYYGTQFLKPPLNERSAREIENKQEIDDGPLHQAVAISTIIIRAHMSSIWFMGVLLSAHNEQYQCIGAQNFEGHRTLTQSNWVTRNVNRKLSHRRIPIKSHSSHGQNAYFRFVFERAFVILMLFRCCNYEIKCTITIM